MLSEKQLAEFQRIAERIDEFNGAEPATASDWTANAANVRAMADEIRRLRVELAARPADALSYLSDSDNAERSRRRQLSKDVDEILVPPALRAPWNPAGDPPDDEPATTKRKPKAEPAKTPPKPIRTGRRGKVKTE